MNTTDRSRAGLSWIQYKTLDNFYRQANQNPAQLPWHREQPDPLLAEVATGRPPGYALDIGCGSGLLSAYLAKLGFRVTAIDIHPDAVAMAHRLSKQESAFEVRQADILNFRHTCKFDLILDSGCLHNLSSRIIPVYCRKITNLLADNGDFILEHWDKRHRFDWRPVGPIRRSQASIIRFFKPWLSLQQVRSQDFKTAPPIGPNVRGSCYHFQKNHS